MGSTTEGSAFEVTANPWDLSTVPGGSAAAVSARQCVVSLGSDTGESVKLSKMRLVRMEGQHQVMKVLYLRMLRFKLILS
ncbi:glutamyl-tRNA(Gln) amidotransferase subunit A, chloroplastic/mitochondrial isoform X1 [Arachis hypogaea]|uniref:glutamyl-tRNA(Gln) amidotransferase subunit A, chloroplastic/mitochondrial isoform X1 n=1 Tax=Arachis hypogaea TaxID=3818 RepID=UPI000DECCC90|nr:glutamyl-tRNA(Gln) amidotransferase subunit A, chloroplastic/mitochondrial [Arachis hypogaea]